MTKSFTLDKPKRSEGWAKFQEWNRKWNRILASVFCILCFILLFAIVSVNIIETKEIQMEKSTSTTNEPSLQTEYDETIETITSLVKENDVVKIKTFVYQTTPVCTISGCTINCKNDVLESVNSEIELAYQNGLSSCHEIDLVLTDYNSANKTLYTDWYTLSYPVRKLQIHQSHFETIDDYAFSGGKFGKTKIIYLTQLQSLKQMTKNMFVGMGSVTEVHFENLSALNYIDVGILDPMQAKIESFAIHHMPSSLLIDNITGHQYLSSQIVSLEYNSYGDAITNSSFAGLKEVISLFMQSSKISSLPRGVFDKLSKLQLIHLKNNLLRTIPSGIFDIVVPLKIYLSGNNFNCTCNEGILYLQQFINTYPTNLYDNITCSTPNDVFNQLLETVDIYCPPDTSTSNLDTNTPDYHTKNTNSETDTTFLALSTIVTTTEVAYISSVDDTSSTKLTTAAVSDIYLNCEDHTNFGTASYVKPVTSEGRSAEFKIIKDSNFDIFIEFFDAYYYPDLTLLWFTNSTSTESIVAADLEGDQNEGSIEYKCADNVQRRVKIEDLRQDTLYIFCVVDKQDGRVLPFNCAAFRLICDLPSHEIQDSEDSDDIVWISKSHKVMAIAIFSASLLLALITGGLIMYCCLKSFPFFVVNKKQRKSSRSWLNERDEIIEYHAPPNYITPTPARRSTKLCADRPPPLNTRRFSETSAGSARSYVSAVTPSPFDIISFRMNNNKKKFRHSSNKPEATYDEARDNIMYMEKFPDIPPPLPPHPNRRSNQSNVSSNQSTSSASSNDPLFSISYRVQHNPDQCCTNSYA